MPFYSTKNPKHQVGLSEAVLHSLPPDNGLYMPTEIPKMDDSFWTDLSSYSFQELSTRIAQALLASEMPGSTLEEMVYRAVDFPAPLVSLDVSFAVLELFHGPSMAFKDFGARFMAELMSWLNRGEDRELVVLVATSGDTGGAVAAGFHGVPGIRVIILYPTGKVSPLQEKQLTTWGGNVEAIAVEGTFDDCQSLVKQAFLDAELNTNTRLTSANSINIARLIPQSFYYVEAWKQALGSRREPAFIVPSGNFGNLTAGLLAQRMGMPVRHFVAATNANDIVPRYLTSGKWEARATVATLSNAMDVGRPSNFPRIADLYGSTWNHIKAAISGYRFDDEDTLNAMREVKDSYNYTIDPHGAVGYLAAKTYLQQREDLSAIILETAHPAKFGEVVQQALGTPPSLPPALAELMTKPSAVFNMSANYDELKSYIQDR